MIQAIEILLVFLAKWKEGKKMLKDLSLEEYLEIVDSDAPTPGGGSVGALVGDLGAALSRMLAHLSLNKKKFIEATQEQKEMFVTAANDIKHYKEMLIDGIDGDALSYQCVVTAYKIKDEFEIQRALKTSAFIALDIQKNALSALAGAILLQSCIEISFLNVQANAKLLIDEVDRHEFIIEGQRCIDEGKVFKEAILNAING